MPITWNYKASEFVVKLDVWDVVDKGRRAADTLESGLKLASGKGSPGAKGGEVPEAVQNMVNLNSRFFFNFQMRKDIYGTCFQKMFTAILPGVKNWRNKGAWTFPLP